MGRNRSTMSVVTDMLNQQVVPVTSAALALECDLTLQQTKDALKVLSQREEIKRVKDPASSRGFLYLPKRPPAYKFVDPDVFDVTPSTCSVAWMRQQLSVASYGDFSTLNTEGKNAPQVFNRSI